MSMKDPKQVAQRRRRDGRKVAVSLSLYEVLV